MLDLNKVSTIEDEITMLLFSNKNLWWNNITDIGSDLHKLKNSVSSKQTLNLAKQYTEQALKSLNAKNIDVVVSLVDKIYIKIAVNLTTADSVKISKEFFIS